MVSSRLHLHGVLSALSNSWQPTLTVSELLVIMISSCLRREFALAPRHHGHG